jgi:putative DNA primase/helicase
MTNTPTERLLSRLSGVRRTGPDKWQALCPGHDDHEPSLSIGTGADGRALVHCHAGCDTENDIVAKIGLAMRDLFLHRSKRKGTALHVGEQHEPLTVGKLAEFFGLDVCRLVANGVEDIDGGVLIRYQDLDGRDLTRKRIRTNLLGSRRFKWAETGPIFPYGLQHLALWLQFRRYLILVEGESDVWAGWEHGVPTLGIPGATQARCLRRELVEGFDRLYILREPDSGGEVFVTMIPAQLAKMGWSGDLSELRLKGAKDLAELHRQDTSRFDLRLKMRCETRRS